MKWVPFTEDFLSLTFKSKDKHLTKLHYIVWISLLYRKERFTLTDYNEEKCIEMKQMTPFQAVTVEAMAYVPYQQYKTIYSAEKGLENGTIFLNLINHFGNQMEDMK